MPYADKQKAKDYAKQWNLTHKEDKAISGRKNYAKFGKKYIFGRLNLTSEQYNEIFNRQGGCCAVCGSHQSTLRRSLAVDHDHSCCPGRKTCGKCIRGLLCDNCNFLIGHAKNSVEILLKAAKYLEKK